MPANPPDNMPRITPYLYYEDVAGALAWLARVFGLRERPGPDYQNPKRLGQATQSLYVLVDEVDKHFQHAKESGAKILEKPQDQFYGDRRYGTEDPGRARLVLRSACA